MGIVKKRAGQARVDLVCPWGLGTSGTNLRAEVSVEGFSYGPEAL